MEGERARGLFIKHLQYSTVNVNFQKYHFTILDP